MTITFIDIYRLSIPMRPFQIATGTMSSAQNLFIRVHTDGELTGVGECSAFPMIVGETQSTCYAMAQDFAALWKGKDPLALEERLAELDAFTAYNSTAKSAFDMALYDLAAKNAGLPLYSFLGGRRIPLETDLTIGIGTPEEMAAQAADFKKQGVTIIKVKLGKKPADDVARVNKIREAVGAGIILRLDANQGWDFDGAAKVLSAMGGMGVEFCEQPMRYRDDHRLPELLALSPVKIMADESVFDHHDAERLIRNKSCDYVNIKFSKSGGLHEALKIDEVCAEHNIPCMMGGMLESRMALTCFAHFATARENVRFYDMDTCLLGHKLDPVTGGVRYNGFLLELSEAPGIGADIDENFLRHCVQIRI